jgi:hypothetical protein
MPIEVRLAYRRATLSTSLFEAIAVAQMITPPVGLITEISGSLVPFPFPLLTGDPRSCGTSARPGIWSYKPDRDRFLHAYPVIS